MRRGENKGGGHGTVHLFQFLDLEGGGEVRRLLLKGKKIAMAMTMTKQTSCISWSILSVDSVFCEGGGCVVISWGVGAGCGGGCGVGAETDFGTFSASSSSSLPFSSFLSSDSNSGLSSSFFSNSDSDPDPS